MISPRCALHYAHATVEATKPLYSPPLKPPTIDRCYVDTTYMPAYGAIRQAI
jgi:hypothetical protein